MNPRRRLLLPTLVIATAALLGACGDDTVLGVAVVSVHGDGGAGQFPFFTAAQVAAAQVSCQALPSAVTSVTSDAQEQALLLGSWLSCSGASDLPGASSTSGFTSNIDGMQFTADGEYRNLVLDPDGNLTSGVSPITLVNGAKLIPSSTVDGGADGARISYTLLPYTDDPENNDSGYIEIMYADRSTGGTYATFESSPLRLTDSSAITYVYMGP